VLAYKDTWRQGLDSFLTMLRRRLELLKELLAPTGSIYVHLDWHAVHYVKVLMDEVFRYENFRSEVVWQRTIRTTILTTMASTTTPSSTTEMAAHPTGANPTRPAEPEYFDAHDFERDDHGRRYRKADATGAGQGPPRRFGDQWIEPPTGRHWAWDQDEVDRMYKEGFFVSVGVANRESRSMWMTTPPSQSRRSGTTF